MSASLIGRNISFDDGPILPQCANSAPDEIFGKDEDDPCLRWFRKTVVRRAGLTFEVAKSWADADIAEAVQKACAI
jgi:hypothetical protein